MATGTVKLTFTQPSISTPDNTQRSEVLFGVMTFSAASDTYATAGLVATFTPLEILKSNQLPNIVEIFESPAAGTSPTGWIAIYCPGTTIANGKVALFNGTTEFGNGTALTTPAGSVWNFRVSFSRY